MSEQQYAVSVMFETGQTVMWTYRKWQDAIDHARRILTSYKDCIVSVGPILELKGLPQKSHKKNTKRP